MGDDTMVPCSVCGHPGHWESSHAGDFDNLLKVKAALHTILDCVDYMKGNCKVTAMVGAALPPEVIKNARKTL